MGVLSSLRRRVLPKRPYDPSSNFSSVSTLVQETNKDDKHPDNKPSNQKHPDAVDLYSRCSFLTANSSTSSIGSLSKKTPPSPSTGRATSTFKASSLTKTTISSPNSRAIRTENQGESKQRTAGQKRARHGIVGGQRLTFDGNERVQTFMRLRDGARYPVRPWQMGTGHVYGDPQMLQGGGYIGRRTGRPAGVTRRM